MDPFTNTGRENRRLWDGRRRDFMEVWYVTLPHAASEGGLWIRYTITAPVSGNPYCELWAFYFDGSGRRSFAGKQRFSIDHLGSSNGRDDGAIVRIGDAWLSENHLEGEISRAGRYLSWSLDFEPADRCFQHLPPSLRSRIEKRVSTVCSPNLSVPFTGTVKLDGDVLEFDGEKGCQSHRWGRKHSGSWSWAHCSSFAGAEDSVFEGLAARTTLGPIPVPTMTFTYLRHEGEELVFNDVKWALRARSRYEMPTWAFTAHNDSWRIAGAGRARTEQMVQVRYEDPDGSPRYCANTEIADLGIEIYKRSDNGWRHHTSLTALRSAALEFGRRQPFPELDVSL